MRGALLQAGGSSDVINTQEAAARKRDAPPALAVQHPAEPPYSEFKFEKWRALVNFINKFHLLSSIYVNEIYLEKQEFAFHIEENLLKKKTINVG
ncbi:UNVERIFIED_CONTAM: hypothetical protein K2H54_054022, partial [Gekko kuhli]